MMIFRLTARLRSAIFIIGIISLALSHRANAEEIHSSCTNSGITSAYISAVESKNVEAMSHYWASDIHYQDPTMAYFSIEPIDKRGIVETKDFWQQAFVDSNTQELDYRVKHCFQAGYDTILTLDLRLKLGGLSWDINKDSIEVGFIHIMNLHIRDGKIAKQIDYVDYRDMADQITQLKQTYGSKDNTRSH